MSTEWYIKHSIKNIDDMVLPQDFKTEVINTLINNNNSFRYIFDSKAKGVGKSNTAELIGKLSGREILKVNAGAITGKAEIKSLIEPFIKTVYKKGSLVIIEEMQAMRQDTQEYFNETIDDSIDVSWILTTNNYEKITSAIRSRFKYKSFDFKDKDKKEVINGYYKRLLDICKLEEADYTEDTIKKIILKNFPSFRSTLVEAETIYNRNNKCIKDTLSHDVTDISLEKFTEVMINKNFEAAFAILETKSIINESVYKFVHTCVYPHIKESKRLEYFKLYNTHLASHNSVCDVSAYIYTYLFLITSLL